MGTMPQIDTKAATETNRWTVFRIGRARQQATDAELACKKPRFVNHWIVDLVSEMGEFKTLRLSARLSKIRQDQLKDCHRRQLPLIELIEKDGVPVDFRIVDLRIEESGRDALDRNLANVRGDLRRLDAQFKNLIRDSLCLSVSAMRLLAGWLE
jgi:hypothetical protein